MTQIIVTRTINASIDLVFKTIADIRNFSKALPHVVNFEFLSDSKTGVGTQFRETRLMKGKKSITELEVTEYMENNRIRMVADSHGTVWDTTFTVDFTGGKTTLILTMDAKAYKLLPKILNPLIKGMIKKAIERDMDLVKSYCESSED